MRNTGRERGTEREGESKRDEMENKKRIAWLSGERLKVVKKGEVEEIAGYWQEEEKKSLSKGEKIDYK